MEVKLLADCKYGKNGDVVKIDDAAVAQGLIDAGVAEATTGDDTPVEGEAIEKAFTERNKKALRDEAKKIEDSFEAKMKALKEHVERTEAELAQLKAKAPAPNLGSPAIKPDNKFGFKSMGESAHSFLHAKMGNSDYAARHDNYIKSLKSKFPGYGSKSTTLNITNDTAPVPPDFAADIWNPGLDTEFLYQYATALPTSTGSINAPFVKDLDHTANVGGITITSLDPDANSSIPIVESKLGLGSNLVQLELFGALCPISEQMKRWSPYQINSVVGTWMKNAVMFEIENRFHNSSTYGWRTSTSTNPMLNKVTRKTANLIQFVDIQNMLAAFNDPFNPGVAGCYLVVSNQNRYGQLGIMKFPDASGSYPAYLPGGGSMNGDYPSLKRVEGLQVISSEFASALGSEGDAAIIAPKNYWSIRNVNEEYNIEESIWFRFNVGGTSLRLIAECAFAPTRAGRTKQKNGSYVSPFVVLDDVVSS